MIEWETLSTDDYQKNIGRLKIGNNYWNFDQEFKSFATLENQELLFSVNISSVSADIEVAFLFHHMVRKTILNFTFFFMLYIILGKLRRYLQQIRKGFNLKNLNATFNIIIRTPDCSLGVVT